MLCNREMMKIWGKCTWIGNGGEYIDKGYND